MSLPRLRPNLDAYPVRLNGRDLVAVRDPEGVAEKPVLLSPQTFFVAILLDGERDVLDVQAEYARRSGGTLLFSWDLQRIIEELDRHGLLESDTLRARREAIEATFRAAAVRAPFHAGTAYPADPQALRRMLTGHLEAVAQDELADLEPRGIIAPHIDLARGGWCYGWAYAALARRPPRTCLLLGVAHGAPPVPIVLTAKPFATPLGTVPVDREAVQMLQDRLGDLSAHEIVHRTEHSLEFQVLFLQAIGGDRPASIVPILVSALERWVPPGESPRRVDAVERVIAALQDAVSARAGEIAVVVGVDFSHVGARFGDSEPPSPALAARTSARDREVLEAIVLGDAEAFWRRVTLGGNPQRIDALSAVYIALRVLEPVRGRLLRYGTAEDPAGGIVSFASLALL
ncbi:MAG: AmmeMemoRadiSam system protein B [Armatimonadota bacterium]|nr:AmmeMemoRadiSam system protein B [Armatimonadota bacterium]MDR7549592.1 AmmeMemoRadiSam system protein B [Armatimonadota bacterium]